MGIGQGDFDRFEPYTQSYAQKYGIPESQVGKPKHICDALADAMEETVQRLASQKEPFYLQLHAYAVHGPVQSRPDLKEKALKRLSPQNSRKANLAGFISGMDAVLGRLLLSLEDPNGDGDKSDSVARDTLVLFTSDNGGTHGDNLPLRGVKGMFTEGGIQAPDCLLAGRNSSQYSHQSDGSWNDLSDPNRIGWKSMDSAEKNHPLDGESFAGILNDPTPNSKRSPIFICSRIHGRSGPTLRCHN